MIISIAQDKTDYSHRIDLLSWDNQSPRIRPKSGPNQLIVTWLFVKIVGMKSSDEYKKVTYSLASQIDQKNFPVLTHYFGN